MLGPKYLPRDFNHLLEEMDQPGPFDEMGQDTMQPPKGCLYSGRWQRDIIGVREVVETW
jgi:hypothetical protein